jgi:hypothetical protein
MAASCALNVIDQESEIGAAVMSLRDAALAWAARGFRVFPLQPNGRRPTHEGWHEWASNDPATVAGWWNGSPDANIGVLTTGLLVADLDCKEGRRGLDTWMSLHGGFDTLTVRTPSGGLHLYYSGAEVANSQGEHGGLGPGLDVRGHHGYVIAPGSVVDGRAYRIEIDRPMAPAPRSIVALCRPPGFRAENASVALVAADNPQAIALATDAIARFPAAAQGEQSIAVYKLAAAVRDYGVSELMAAALMAQWAARCAPPIPHDDVSRIVANAYLYAQNPAGAKHPEAMFGKVDLPPLPVVHEPINGHTVAGLHFGNAIPAADQQPRDWLRYRFLMRGHVTMLVAPGGVGKSLVQLTTAACLANGADVFDFRAPHPGQWHKSVVYNAEDTLEEMSMRLVAICATLGFDYPTTVGRILLISGKTHGRVRIINGGKEIAVNEDALKMLMQWAMDPEVAMLAMDPLAKLHTAQEIDNMAMTFVMDVMEMMAEKAHVAVLLSHHTSKQSMSSSVRFAGNADSSRGAGSIINGPRFTFTLSSMTEEDAAHYAITESERPWFLRLDDGKMNYGVKSEKALWLQRVSYKLWCGEDVGALQKADMHVRTEGLRQNIASIIDDAMMGLKHTAALKVTDAVAMLRQDPMFGKLPVNVAKQRMLSALADPVTLPNGHVIKVVEQAGSVMIVMA